MTTSTEASQLTVADLSNRKTFEAQHNQRPIDEILAEFRSARSRLVSKVEKIDLAIFARARTPSASENTDAAGGPSCTLWRSTMTITWPKSGN